MADPIVGLLLYFVFLAFTIALMRIFVPDVSSDAGLVFMLGVPVVAAWITTALIRKGRNRRAPIGTLIRQLQADHAQHTDVGPLLSEGDVLAIESRLGLRFSPSYRAFLTAFGDGAYWLYGCQPVDSARRATWLMSIRPDAPSMVPSDATHSVPLKSLLCLMSEDSNGGSWCWITDRPKANGEMPLAYYYPTSRALVRRVDDFTAWLRLLIASRQEVIRSLDPRNDLGLG